MKKTELDQLFKECEHGDAEHRQWLKDKFEDFYNRNSKIEKDYRSTDEGRLRFANPEIYQKSIEFQDYLFHNGIAWHNSLSGECTRGFECCSKDKTDGIAAKISVDGKLIIDAI
jgi:hypothetical protein